MTQRTSTSNAYEVFLDVYLQELIECPDAEILEGVDAAAEEAAGLRLLAAAKAEAGRRRLAQARAAMAQAVLGGNAARADISAAEARRYIRAAVNDPRFTLAARQLDELSDDDVILVYSQLTQLKSSPDDSPSGDR